MSHTSTTATAAAPRRSAAQWAIIAVLAFLGVLALVVAVLFATGAANSIHILSGSVHHGHHQVRLTVAIVAGVLLFSAAGYFIRTTAKSLGHGRVTAMTAAAAARRAAPGLPAARARQFAALALSGTVPGGPICPAGPA